MVGGVAAAVVPRGGLGGTADAAAAAYCPTVGRWAEGVSLASLTSGALGAALATLGAFAVAWFTVRHDRTMAGRREARERAAQDRVLRHRTAIAALRAVHAFATEHRWYPLMTGQTELALLDLLGSAWVDLTTEHPAVAEWVRVRHDDLAKMPTWRGWGRQIWARTRAVTYSRELGAVAGQLTAWAAGSVDDAWFAEDLARRAKAESPHVTDDAAADSSPPDRSTSQ